MMIIDMASAASVLLLLLSLWLAPLAIFLLTARLNGLEQLSWALMIAVLSWPGFAVYLFYAGSLRNRD